MWIWFSESSKLSQNIEVVLFQNDWNAFFDRDTFLGHVPCSGVLCHISILKFQIAIATKNVDLLSGGAGGWGGGGITT